MAKINGGIIGPNNPTSPFVAGGVWRLEDAFNAQKAGTWPVVLGYQVPNSVRFNAGSNDFLSRTTGTPTNNKILTFSTWIKRSTLSTYMDLFDQDGGSSYGQLQLTNGDAFVIYQRTSGSTDFHLQTTQLFRDVSAWYHLVVAYDTSQATAANRIKLYVNGTQVTSFSIETYPSQNLAIRQNSSSLGITIANYSSGSNQYAGYMSEIYMIDGQQLTPSSFGETDATTGIWIPKAYTGTYGTNGFYLKFANSASLGTDSSGNGNNFTVNNLTSIDQSYDSPTNNFATANNLDNYYFNGSFTNGNLTVTSDTTSYTWNTGTIGVSTGKWYWEIKVITETTGSQSILGISSSQSTGNTQELGDKATDYGYYASNGNYRNNNTNTAYGNTYAVGDIISFALDLDNNKLYFGKNGTWQNSGVPTSGATGTGAISITAPSSTPLGAYFPAWCFYDSSNYAVWDLNFGYPPFTISSGNADANGFGNFEYAVPSGYYALCSKNLAIYG